MRGANFLALLAIAAAVLLLWLAWSGNYRATFQALRRPYQGGSQLSNTSSGSGGH